jgi:hypothetical protein
MSLVILFDGNQFNNFPIRSLKNDTTIILGSDFIISDNKKFVNDVNIRGLRLIEVVNAINLKNILSGRNNKNFINLIIKNKDPEKNDQSIEFDKIPILYYSHDSQDPSKLSYICKHCKDLCIKKNFLITKHMKPPSFCSDECIIENSKTEIDFTENSMIFQISSESENRPIKNPKTFLYVGISSSKDDKFQDSMRREAVRLEYAERREKYKKHMRQISSRKSNTSTTSAHSFKKDSLRSVSNKESNGTRICKALTKKNVKCTNKSVRNSDFCGIASHKKQNKEILKNKLEISKESKKPKPIII